MSAECSKCGYDLRYGEGMTPVCSYCEVKARFEEVQAALHRQNVREQEQRKRAEDAEAELERARESLREIADAWNSGRL